MLIRGAFVKFSHPDGMSAKEIEGMCSLSSSMATLTKQ